MTPLLRCLNEKEVLYALQEVHEGMCGNYSDGQSLALKILCQGYFWTTMKLDALQFVRKCDKCQYLIPIIKKPLQEISFVIIPWPFTKSRVDLIGPMPTRMGKTKFVIVAIDYFTKWAETEPLVKITEQKTTDVI